MVLELRLSGLTCGPTVSGKSSGTTVAKNKVLQQLCLHMQSQSCDCDIDYRVERTASLQIRPAAREAVESGKFARDSRVRV